MKNTTNIKQLQGDWNEQKIKLKRTFPILNDSDLIYEEGRKFEMLEKLQVKLSKTKEQLLALIESL